MKRRLVKNPLGKKIKFLEKEIDFIEKREIERFKYLKSSISHRAKNLFDGEVKRFIEDVILKDIESFNPEK